MKKTLILLSALVAFWACTPAQQPQNNQNNPQGQTPGGDPADPENPGNNPGGGGDVTPDFSAEAWYQTNFWERTDREKEGLRGPVKKWHVINYTTYDEYEYDNAGRLVKDSYVNTTDSDSNHEWRYTYDSNGHCIKQAYYDIFYTDGTADYTEFEYNNPGKFVAADLFFGPQASGAVNGIVKDLSRAFRVITQPDRTNYQETTYTFGEDGNLTVENYSYIVMLGSEEREYENRYSYTWVYEGGYPKSLESENLSVKVLGITYYPNGMYKDFVSQEVNSYNYDTGWDTHTFKMLDNPRYLAIETFELGGTPSFISLTPGKMLKTYDEHYDIVKNEEWYEDVATPTFTDTYQKYTYDKYGNWVTREETIVARWTGQESITTIEREIEYY